MNRDILFRGKDIKTGEWIEGSLVVTKFNAFIVPMYDESVEAQRAYSVHKNTVGQFTGQTDKNDKRIFEGDILKLADEELQVIYNEFYGCFELMYKGGDSEPFNDTSNSPDECEVIGNIHETQPESEK